MNKLHKKIGIGFGIVFILVFGYIGVMIAPGSNAYSQKYKIYAKPNVLIKAVENFKRTRAYPPPHTDFFDSSRLNFKASIYSMDAHATFHFEIDMSNPKSEYSSLYLISINRSG